MLAVAKRRLGVWPIVLLGLLPLIGNGASAEGADTITSTMRLPVRRVGKPPAQYVEFCNANPGHCDMVGASVLVHSDALMQVIAHVNREVNAAYRLVPDLEAHDAEDLWSYPSRGMADCEDFALEKRKRLVERGLARAALTIGIVQQKKLLCWHVVLLVETSIGTYVLDNITDDILPWSQSQYNFEGRERVDGKWDYFDQAIWLH